jgi:glycosyltransferase involved in cell wall biosynthesis
VIKVCWLLGSYISHLKAGRQFRAALAGAGATLVPEPDAADAVVIHNEPWSLPSYWRAFPALRGRRVISYSVWETDRLSDRQQFALALPDEVWTCSAFSRDALAPAARRIAVLPHVVERPVTTPAALAWMRGRIGYRDDLRWFYTIGSVRNPRKGVTDLLRAFATLPADRTRLVIKCDVPLPPEVAALPGVIAIPERLPEPELAALHHLGDAFVSAHRSEAWGLGLSEAMASGNLAIATAHGGNLAFMHAGNALLVPCRVERIRDDEVRASGLLSAEMSWGYVDVPALGAAMRRALDDWDGLAGHRERARSDVVRFAPATIGAQALEMLATSSMAG